MHSATLETIYLQYKPPVGRIDHKDGSRLEVSSCSSGGEQSISNYVAGGSFCLSASKLSIVNAVASSAGDHDLKRGMVRRQ